MEFLYQHIYIYININLSLKKLFARSTSFNNFYTLDKYKTIFIILLFYVQFNLLIKSNFRKLYIIFNLKFINL